MHIEVAQWIIITSSILIVFIGCVIQYSCAHNTDSFLNLTSIKKFFGPVPIRHALWCVIGGTFALIISLNNFEKLLRFFCTYLFYASILALLYLATASGIDFIFGDSGSNVLPFVGSTKGGYRWLQGPGVLEIFKIQPSEFAKLSLTLFLCKYFAEHSKLLAPQKSWHGLRLFTKYALDSFNSKKNKFSEYKQDFLRWKRDFVVSVATPLFWMGLFGFLVLAGRSLSMTVLFSFQCFIISLCAGFRYGFLLAAGIVLSYCAWCGHDYGMAAPFRVSGRQELYTPKDASNEEMVMSKYNILRKAPKELLAQRLIRFSSWKHPDILQKDGGNQLWLSQIALGAGGLKGSGIGEGRIKRDYLPEIHNDFVFAVIGEEFGFVGTILVILLYVSLFVGAYYLAWAVQPFLTLSLSSLGLGLSIGAHAFINIGVTTGVLPTTGITAPFLSYGGSSMIVGMITIGLLCSIARTAKKKLNDLGVVERTNY